MEISFSDKKIEFDKELNSLDLFVVEFLKILNKLEIKYVIVSGYTGILFGRSRASEDVDLLVEKLDFEKFSDLWGNIYNKFECINTENVYEAFNNYLQNNLALRFSRKRKFIPNMEVKFPKSKYDYLVLDERINVSLNNEHEIFISPLELQISFKLSLGSEKDIEDARFLYKLFKSNLNLELLKQYNEELGVENLFDEYLEG